ncbi:MAG: MBL fold metallo-hydrolase [Acidobacteria bacterium]|nr:MBL fold metallo-hydrolase [Acidobacteriota bacterium]
MLGRLLIVSALLSFVVSTSAAPDFTIERIAPDVYAVIRTEPASLWFNPNTVIIVGKRFVTVVDTNISSAYTRDVLAALRKITRKPVRYVVNTHWHDDHIIGNRVYRDEFPGVEFIAHESTLTDLPTIGAANRKGSVDNGPGFAAFLRKTVEKGENLAGNKLTEEERLGYLSDASLVESYLAESKDFEIVLPTRTVKDKTTIDDGKRKIEILFLGRAHTGADIVVHLPKERIVASGDLIVSPIPLVGSTSYPLEYAATLEKLIEIRAKITIPGHGPIFRDDKYAKQMIELLKSVKRQTEASYAKGENLEQMRKSVNLDEFVRMFAGESQHKRFVFDNYVFLPATAAAFKQLSAK